jgi:hypothetical protein
MDSIADHIILPSAIVWMLMFRRGMLVSYSTLLIPSGSIYLLAILIGLIRSAVLVELIYSVVNHSDCLDMCTSLSR